MELMIKDGIRLSRHRIGNRVHRFFLFFMITISVFFRLQKISPIDVQL